MKFSKVGAVIGAVAGSLFSTLAAQASLITVPTSTTVLTDTGTWSSALFTDVLPIALIGAGLLVGGMVASFVLGKIVAGVKKVVGGGRRSGGRRRR